MIIILNSIDKIEDDRIKTGLKNVISDYLISEQVIPDVYFEEDRFFTFPNDNVITALSYADILFFEKSDKQVQIHTAKNQYCYYGSMISLENRLEPEQFLRVHQAFIVNRSKIRAYSNGQLILDPLHYRVPVSRRHQKHIKSLLT